MTQTDKHTQMCVTPLSLIHLVHMVKTTLSTFQCSEHQGLVGITIAGSRVWQCHQPYSHMLYFLSFCVSETDHPIGWH